MKKFLLFLLPVILAVLVFVGFMFFLSKDSLGKGALQVTSVPQSNVYLNGRLIGKTPLCECDVKNMIATGDYTIRLVPIDSSLSGQTFEQKITINKAVLTVVDQTFGLGATSQGSVISLSPSAETKNASLFVSSFPDGASVSVDNNPSGQTPYKSASITESDHDLIISKPGYKEKHVRIHAVTGYTLSVIAFLGVDLQSSQASSSAPPVASISATPTQQKVVILDTPTGFLRVHKDASISSPEIAQVKPQEEYVLKDEQTGWFEITLKDGTVGWISTQYAQKK